MAKRVKKRRGLKTASKRSANVKKAAAKRKMNYTKKASKRKAAPKKKPAKRKVIPKKRAAKKKSASRKIAAKKRPSSMKGRSPSKKRALKPASRKSSSRKRGTAGAPGKKLKKKKPASKRPLSRKKTLVRKKALTRSARKGKTAWISVPHKPPVNPPFPAYSGSLPYLFISYSHQDMKTVFSTIKKMNNSRYRIWYDEGIEPGNEWPEVVGKAIIRCSQFLVFMSPYATKSRHVRNEINLAFNENKEILVAFLKETRLTEGMKLQIGTVQCINKYELTEMEFIDKLKKVIDSKTRS